GVLQPSVLRRIGAVRRHAGGRRFRRGRRANRAAGDHRRGPGGVGARAGVAPRGRVLRLRDARRSESLDRRRRRRGRADRRPGRRGRVRRPALGVVARSLRRRRQRVAAQSSRTPGPDDHPGHRPRPTGAARGGELGRDRAGCGGRAAVRAPVHPRRRDRCLRAGQAAGVGRAAEPDRIPGGVL
ncbi:MAG: hypothetical protein AVDCRST_MAG73-1345, partial [uncultured Thermomicrobiales bacterium]